MALTKAQKQDTTTDIKNHDTDTGSTEVQIALQTKRIAELSDHLKTHPKDLHSRRGLLQIVADRRKMIKYLQAQGKDRYNALATKLGLKTV
jgi:small subunit ribosomal protein S15